MVTATSTQDPTKQGTASVTIKLPTTLAVSIVNLPGGIAANVTISDPNGQQIALTSSQTINAVPGTYMLTASPVTVGTNSYHATRPTQNVGVTDGAAATATVDYYDIVPVSTKVLDSAGAQSLTVSPDGSVLTISDTSSIAASLQAGNVLVSAPAPSAPNGLLVKVLSVTNDGTTVTANVTPAALVDAISKGQLAFNQAFDSNAVAITNLIPGSRIYTARQARAARDPRLLACNDKFLRK